MSKPGPTQRLCREVLQRKYLAPRERGVEDVFDRVAHALAMAEDVAHRRRWQRRFRANLQAGAIGGGRIMAGAGRTDLDAAPVTLINCFVQPIGSTEQGWDEQGRPGVSEALAQTQRTLRMGGGVGLDFSAVAPQGQSGSIGPCGVIDRFEQACRDADGLQSRRGAQMAVLRIDHPDAPRFIAAKTDLRRWPHFTTALAVPQDFMQGLAAGRAADPGTRALWDQVLQAAWTGGEPGLLFIDRIQNDSNLRAQETLRATNPCAEQPLPDHGGCDLGPLILPRFVRHGFHRGGPAAMDWDRLEKATAVQVRALDNVLDITEWPLEAQRRQAQATRRIGVGFTGLADALMMLGLRYDSPDGRGMAAQIARRMRDAAYGASVELARHRGAFPAFHAGTFLEPGTFASRLPPALQARIARHGIRNSHLLSIAPTGSVSLAFGDNCSPGIEPIPACRSLRHLRQADGSLSTWAVEDAACRAWRLQRGRADCPPAFVDETAVSPQDQVSMVAAVQPFIDAGVSKTVQLPHDGGVDMVDAVFLQAWRQGLKGITVYRAGSRDLAPTGRWKAG